MHSNNTKRNILILFLAVMAVYINSIFNPFIFDDFALIVDNPYIKNFANFLYYFNHSVSINGALDFYRPLQTILYAIIYHIFGLNVIPYHFLNIFLQAGDAILIYILLKKIYPEKISFFVSLLWAIHPIQTEAVTYISGIADPLCLFFTLLCILLFSQRRYIYAVFSFILALLSKETAVLIPFLIYIYEYSRVSISYSLPSERYNSFKIWTVPFYNGSNNKPVLSVNKVLWIFPFLGISVLYAILRFTILVKFKPSIIGAFPFLYRFYTSFQAFLQYIQLLIFPNILAMQRYIPYIHTWKNPDFIVGFISVVLILCWLYRIRKNPGLFFPVIWFLVNYIFISDIIFPINGNIREHWMYTPSIGFFILFILGYEILKDKIKINKKYAYIPLIIIFCLYGIRTIVRNHTWKNPITFYKKAIEYFPSSSLYNNLATSYLSENKFHHAAKYFKITLQYSANHYNAFVGLGTSYLKLKKTEQAEKYFQKAISVAPDSPLAYVGLAQVYIVKKDIKKEEEYLKKAIQVGPAYWESYYWLGILYLNAEKYNKADYNLELSSVINPNNALTYNDLGVLYEQIGQSNKALAEFKKAYSIGYENRTIILNFAEAYQVLGNYHSAIFYYQKALGLYPGDPVILNKMAIAFALSGNKQQAIRIWQAILKKYPDFTSAQINLERVLKAKK
jgi:tetratricopeptide (TPR) repeat protein